MQNFKKEFQWIREKNAFYKTGNRQLNGYAVVSEKSKTKQQKIS